MPFKKVFFAGTILFYPFDIYYYAAVYFLAQDLANIHFKEREKNIIGEMREWVMLKADNKHIAAKMDFEESFEKKVLNM